MQIEIIAAILLGTIFGLFALTLITVYVIGQITRPSGTLTNYKARFNLSVYSAEEIDRAFVLFEQEWAKHHPKSTKKVRKVLNSINIQWEPQRWQRSGKSAAIAAELTHSYTIRVWIGPKLSNKPRNIAYTGLVNALVQAVLYNVYGETTENIKKFNKLALNVNMKLLGHVKDD